MAVLMVDQTRFDKDAPEDQNAKKHRASVLSQIIKPDRPPQMDNGDFAIPDRRGSFSKGLRHDAATGLVDVAAFNAFTTALAQPRNQVFAAIEETLSPHLGTLENPRKWVNPVAGRAFSVLAGDPQQYGNDVMPPARFGSEELSFEIIENYWMALLRDVPFSQYSKNGLAAQAAEELTRFRDAAVLERRTANAPVELLAPRGERQSYTKATIPRAVSRRRQRAISLTVSYSPSSLRCAGLPSTQ